MPGPEIWAPSSMRPDETDVTVRRISLMEPVKETKTGLIELPAVTAATGKLELSVLWIAVAAA